ncbi:heterokaryon incompatibility protein-domain-containing protein [Hypoxylon trugodes]|uniref:heterokaryon incompatibility protein-domain-containing protein n=1 Tax=Hypoxylon trugodes TaxID=326681 RepID=UPI0021923534|nr:heterokaryon incompatibility protein-domain-containing protein [Hypoxylon trugodes]KAI1389442.1 heterokaryon incompatibility protein-domain-containing protein [Hypoxylon trugodes]
MGSYQHTPLASNTSIRVVDLLPAWKRAAPLRCRIREIDIGDRLGRLPYEALSYVRGSRRGTIPITCDGKQLLITPNCRDALIHLRSKYCTRTLWIDSICIDHRDTENAIFERNGQVLIMGELYSRALRVIVWLGLENKTIRRLFLCISLYKSLTPLLKRLTFPAFEGNRDLTTQILDLICSTPKSQSFNQCLDQMLCNSWFERVWTVQEIAFSQNCVFMSGHVSVSWDAFRELILFYWLIRQDIDDRKPLVSLRFYRFLLDEYSRPSSKEWTKLRLSERRKEMDLLKAVRCFQATIPHDRLYDLHAVLPTSLEQLSIPEFLKPAGNTRPIDTTAYQFLVGYMSHRDNRAGRDSKFTVLNDQPRGSLCVRGKLLGTIKQKESMSPAEILEQRKSPTNISGIALQEVCYRWCRVIVSMSNYLPTGEKPLVALCATLTFHRQTGNCTEDDVKAWSDGALHLESIFPRNRIGGRVPSSEEELFAAFEYLMPIGYYAIGLLDTGYLSMAYHHCQEGDQVFLLAGSDVPIILRPHGHEFRVVAPAYVHGVMKGEAWPDDESQLRDLILV